MKKFTFRITQDLIAYYEGRVTIEAKSKKDARKKLDEMTNREIDEIAFDWEQCTDEARADGDIEIHDTVTE